MDIGYIHYSCKIKMLHFIREYNIMLTMYKNKNNLYDIYNFY